MSHTNRCSPGTLTRALAEAIQPIDYTRVPRPLNYYACSKVFGESLAHMYAQVHGMSCICLRIGWVTADDQVPRPNGRILWCSQRDIVQLVELCITAPPGLRYDVFFGQSDNRHNLVDLEHARAVLGYSPLDNAEDRLGRLTVPHLATVESTAPQDTEDAEIIMDLCVLCASVVITFRSSLQVAITDAASAWAPSLA